MIFTNVIEGKKGIGALVVSRQYVKGYGTVVFVNLLVILGIGLVFSLLFRLIMWGLGLLLYATYLGNLSIISALVIALVVMVVAALIVVLWKSFAFVVLYSMFKKLQAIKAHHVGSLDEGRKTVKIWLILGLITIAICVGVMSALKDYNPRGQGPASIEEAMMYTDY